MENLIHWLDLVGVVSIISTIISTVVFWLLSMRNGGLTIDLTMAPRGRV